MERIRKGTFETNSSSVHTLVMPRPKDTKLNPHLIDNHGVITVSCKYYGDSGIVGGFLEKLRYLCTWIAVANGRGKYGDSEDFTSDDCRDLEKCVLDPIQEVVPAVLKIKVTNAGSADFDHQTHPSNSECVVSLWDTDSVITFLFNDDIYIKMSRD